MISRFQIAYKNLLRKKARTLLTLVGIMLSSWVLVSLLGFNRGYEHALNRDIDNMGYQLMVMAKGCPYEAATMMLQGGTGLRYIEQSMVDSIVKEPEVDKVTPILMQAFFDPNKGESGGIAGYFGVDPATFPAMKPFFRFRQGGWFRDETAAEAVMGFEAAELEQREVGDMILVPEKNVQLKVVGILERTGTQDDGTIFVPLKTLQKISGIDKITTIGIKVKKDADTAELENKLYKLPDVQVVSFTQVKETIMKLISTARVMVLSIAVIALLIAMVGVINTILMSVLERMQEIGILKTMGAMPGDIFRLVWTETLILCTCGGIAGIGFAFLFASVTDVLVRRILPYAPGGGLVAIDAQAFRADAAGHRRRRAPERPLPGVEGGAGATSRIDPEGGMMTEDGIMLEARGLTRVYRRGSEDIRAVDGVSLQIRRGEFVSFMGPSGSGKTTLVNLLGCLDNPTAGELDLAGRSIFGGGKILGERHLTRIRREVFGYIFQNFYLIPTLTVRENVALPLAFYRKPGVEGEVERLLRMLGMEHRMDHLPGQISGGEMQRVAIARALVNRPEILLADEPTGNLDTKRSGEIGEILQELNRSAGLTIVMVSHNPDLARLGGRLVEMRDGQAYET